MRMNAILKQHCPHCLQGQVFNGLFKMYPTCPVCGIEYEREHGFFMMSIFFGYVLGFFIALPVCIVLLLIGAPIIWYLIGVTIVLAPLSPLIFRYSRILWMHLDELFDPRPKGGQPQPPAPN